MTNQLAQIIPPPEFHTKQSMQEVARDIYDYVETGKVSPVEAFVALRQIKEIAEQAMKDITDMTMDTMPDKSLELGAVKLSRVKGRTYYRYSEELQDRIARHKAEGERIKVEQKLEQSEGKASVTKASPDSLKVTYG